MYAGVARHHQFSLVSVFMYIRKVFFMEQEGCPLLIILIKEPKGNKCIYMVDTALISCYFNSLAYDMMRSFFMDSAALTFWCYFIHKVYDNTFIYNCLW
jgi:hypothetical protein